MVSGVHCRRSFLVMTCLILLCFVSIGIEARIMRNGDDKGIIAGGSTTSSTTPMMMSRMTTSTGNSGPRMMITTDDHNNDETMNIPKESKDQLDQEYSAATETTEATEAGDSELVIMDYSPARKKPPIHN